jgi:hypothetical protein
MLQLVLIVTAGSKADACWLDHFTIGQYGKRCDWSDVATE